MFGAIIGLILFIVLVVVYVLAISFIIDRFFYFPKYNHVVLYKPFDVYFKNIKLNECYSMYNDLSDIKIAFKKNKLSHKINKFEISEYTTYYKIDFYWVRETEIKVNGKKT